MAKGDNQEIEEDLEAVPGVMEACHVDLKEFVTGQDVICKAESEDKGLETWQAEGVGEGQEHSTQKTCHSINEVCSNLYF